MNENDLSRHLIGYAAGVEPTPDPEGVRRNLQRVDRNRRLRALGAVGSAIALVVFGFVSLGGDAEPAHDVDVRGDVPAPVPDNPDLGPGSVESQPDEPAATDADTGEVPEADGSDAPASRTTSDDPPVHLQLAPTTTVVPAEVTPTTTAPPPTTPPSSTVAPTTSAPPSTTVPASFSAASRFGSCEEDPPYDEYSGTAAPGATVTITSPYSAPAQTVADGAGNWYLRVEFPASPVNEPFTVTASDGTSSADMSFVHVG